jgi:hypothetical protein
MTEHEAPPAATPPSPAPAAFPTCVSPHGHRRLRALARLGEMADNGDFDEFAGNKAAYRG